MPLYKYCLTDFLINILSIKFITLAFYPFTITFLKFPYIAYKCLKA